MGSPLVPGVGTRIRVPLTTQVVVDPELVAELDRRAAEVAREDRWEGGP
ncbi:MAG TPA: hypothetical protein VFD01_08685 [Candidatus Dormibacteraeota bacterium]|jgi:hypothetical protein|nr:hypothetical protein [Candidatus Dormibacteraeota bacterium]